MEAAREATPGDLPELAALAAQAFEERLPERGGPQWAERVDPVGWTIRGLEHTLEDADAGLFGGLFDDSLIGFGVCKLNRLRTGSLTTLVEELYVLPEARGVGVGEALMDAMIEWAVGRGCGEIESVALPGNRAAKNFFERYGLVARAILVHRRLDQ